MQNDKKANRWKDAVNKFKHALGDSVDSVRVRVSVDSDHLQEIAKGKLSQEFFGQTYEFPMLRMNPKQLIEHQVIYDQSSKALLDHHGNYVSTIDKISKGIEKQQAFVMAKNGSLYIGTHEGQPIDPENPSLSHASFLKGKPAEMAGMISINKKGKIDLITDNSGHYAPEPLDMYRGIKKLPIEVFTEDAKISFHNGKEMSINSFIKDMEHTNDGKTKYQVLREQRIEKLKEYEQNLKNAVHVKLDTKNDDIIKSIINLTPEQQKQLQKGLKQPMIALSMSDAEGKYQNINLSTLIDDIVYHNKIPAMNVLLNAGIANRDWIFDAHPLHKAITQQKEIMIQEMLANPNTKKFLAKEASFSRVNSLHVAASGGNVKIIEEVLKYPEGRNLLEKKDQHGLTPLDSAKKFKHSKAIDILTKAEHSKKFEKILSSKQFKEGSKNLRKNSTNEEATPSLRKKQKAGIVR